MLEIMNYFRRSPPTLFERMTSCVLALKRLCVKPVVLGLKVLADGLKGLETISHNTYRYLLVDSLYFSYINIFQCCGHSDLIIVANRRDCYLPRLFVHPRS